MTRLLVALLLLSGTAACTRAEGSADRFTVVTAFYPLEFLSTRIGGDTVEVTQLAKPGAEPHDVELNPRQVGSISDAGLVVYLSGFQPAVDQAVAQEAGNRAFDVATVADLLPIEHQDDEAPGEEHAEAAGGKDPHVWLDPVRFAAISDRLAERLAAADPANAAGYATRAKELHTRLDALNDEYAAR